MIVFNITVENGSDCHWCVSGSQATCCKPVRWQRAAAWTRPPTDGRAATAAQYT